MRENHQEKVKGIKNKKKKLKMSWKTKVNHKKEIWLIWLNV